MTEVKKCDLGQELILKYSFSKATGKLKYSNDVCPDIVANKISNVANAFHNHFNGSSWHLEVNEKQSNTLCMFIVRLFYKIIKRKYPKRSKFQTNCTNYFI